MANERYPLRQIILDDLTNHNKVAIILLVLIVISALGTIWITHQTRLLVADQGKLIAANQKLENQYIHLQLEENSQSQKWRIESVAEKLQLQAVKKEQEVILVK
ncbi:cell division protein FtsL [Vespertiliibacter pulmonis]|uniref:Cell division protein FtsL n=2 Tax=Vespertiliibacter pulmonis TaxID=1443036 RepID=A0A3N4VTQ6_9PAST|nr:cell division protein FtsL [Vespertiliibacter pulmonis]